MPRWIAWLALLPAGCKANDADLLAQVGRRAGQKVTAGPTNRLAGPVSEVSLATKVHSRLRWDAPLAGADVQVRATAGTVTLRGRVGSDDARRRAVELARTTAGVGQVVDELTVAPAP